MLKVRSKSVLILRIIILGIITTYVSAFFISTTTNIQVPSSSAACPVDLIIGCQSTSITKTREGFPFAYKTISTTSYTSQGQAKTTYNILLFMLSVIVWSLIWYSVLILYRHRNRTIKH